MKTKTILITLIGLLAVSTLVFQACKKEIEPEPPNNDEISIPETTKVIDQNTWNSNFVGLDSSNYNITFKEELTRESPISVGDIIVSQDGYGYLRKVTNIQNEGSNIKVYTSFASISEAIENGSFSFETVLSEQKIMRINYQKEGVVLDTSNMKSTEQTALNYDIDTYLDNNNTVHLQGSFVLLPSVNAELIIKWFKVKKLEVEFVVDEQIDLENTIEMVDVEYEKEIKLAGVIFHPIIVMIGPVPVVIVPELEIFAGVELDVESTVTTSVDQSLSYNAGLLYENSKWSTYKEINKQLNYLPPSLTATAEAKAYIKPQMNLKFYGTVAPYLAGELYGKIDAELQTNPWWSLYGGVSIGAGIEMEIFEKELFDYYTDPPIIEYEVLIIDANTVGDNQAPILPSNPIPSNNAIEQSVNVDVTWECSDPDEDPLTYDIYFGETTNPGLVVSNSSNTSYDPGTLNENVTYHWKIVAKDDHDHTTEGPEWQFTTIDGNNNVVFEDDFSGGNYEQWEFFKYSTGLYGDVPDPEIVNGRLYLTTHDQQNTCLTAGNYSWENYTIEYDVVIEQSLDDGYKGVRTFFNVNDISYTSPGENFKVSGYTLDLKGRDNTWKLVRSYEVGSSNQNYIVAAGSIPISVGEKYEIKIITNNASFKIYFNKYSDPEELLIEISDTQDPVLKGKFGIGGGDDIISIDNVNVYGN